MNSQHDMNDHRQLDRLVDGELSRDEYRDLLVTLEDEPGGWRRCAMAFLEAQAWARELGSVRERGQTNPREIAGRTSNSHANGQSDIRFVGSLVAIAASFVMAFLSGVWWQRASSSDGNTTAPTIVRQENDSSSPQLAGAQPQEKGDSRKLRPMPVEHMTFVVDRGNGESERFELPIYDAKDPFVRRSIEGSSGMPTEVERAIRQLGFSVQSNRQWAPVRLQDGRRAFFPVDELDITPVSASNYH